MSLSQDEHVLAGGCNARQVRSHSRGVTLRRLAGAAAAASLGLAVLASAVDAGAASASTALASSAAAGAANRLVAVAGTPRLVTGERAIGALGASSVVRGAVALRPRSESAIRSFIAEVSSPTSPLFHHYLSKGQYAERFGPTRAAVAAVRAQLTRDGLHVGAVPANRLFVPFSGSATRVEATFATGLERVRLAGGGLGQATTSAVRLPAGVARYVQGVVGLDDLVHPTSGAVFMHGHHSPIPASKLRPAGSGPVACSAALGLQAEGALTDQQVAYAYGLDGLYQGGDLGQGQTVDVYELEPFSISDVATFDKCYFGQDNTGNITTTLVDGGPGTGPGSGEAALDIEDVSAIAPAAKIHVFSGPNMNNSFGPLDTWNAIATADDARQITSSWGLCESDLQSGAPGVQQIENDIFEQTAAQGQSVFSSAGDDGSDDCAGHAPFAVAANLSVDDPASQPYVTAVGGTTILKAGDPPTEQVWNNGALGGGGGGGVSNTWQLPPWQAGVYSQSAAIEACSNDPTGAADAFQLAGLPTSLPSGTQCRLVPDVSALADPQTGITIVYAGQFFPIGGTSSSTPLWAAMTAEMNGSSACKSAGADGLGFVSPLLYTVGTGPHASSALNDVTVGNNDNLAVGDGTNWTAGSGYDLASGLGTPQVTNPDGNGLAGQLCALVGSPTASPSVASVLPNNGSLAGGDSVVISGANFGSSQGTVFFGNAPASVTSWTPGAVTVTAPAFFPGNDSPPNEGGSVVVTVTTAGTPHASSSPNGNSVFHYSGGSSAAGVPVVDYVSSAAGNAAGGNTVTVVGSGFEEHGGVTGVTFGGMAATNVNVLNDDQLTAVVPAQGGSTQCANSTPGICQVEVVVSNVDGPSATTPILPAYTGPIIFQPSGVFEPPAGCGCEVIQQPSEYDYAPTPTITGADTVYASELGGSTITLTGTGFNLIDLYFVNVGPPTSNFSADFAVDAITPTTLTFTAPSDPNFTGRPTVEPDPTEVTVLTAGGLSNVDSAISYAGVPRVGHLSASFGPQSGGSSLTITGEGFKDANEVIFAGQGGFAFVQTVTTNFAVSSDTSITIDKTPAMFAVPTDVLVCSVTGCSSPNPAKDGYVFTYVGRAVLTAATPAAGGEGGGTVVTLNGSLDENVVAVHFGGALGRLMNQNPFSPSGLLQVQAPPSRRAQKVDITITTLGGILAGHPTSAVTSAATFTYHPGAPSAPRKLRVAAGEDRISATWSAPFSDGGFPVTGYVVKATARGHRTVTVSTTARQAVVRGLEPGVRYSVTVVAVNKKGKGQPASAAPVRPT